MDSRPKFKCPAITKNSFFNFMRCFRTLPGNESKPSQQVAIDGGRAWWNLTEAEREVYRQMAEPYLKYPRSRSPSQSIPTEQRSEPKRVSFAPTDRSAHTNMQSNEDSDVSECDTDDSTDLNTHAQKTTDNSRNMNQSTSKARAPQRYSSTCRTHEHTTEGGHSNLCEQVSSAVRELGTQPSHNNHDSGMQAACCSSRSMSRSTERTSRISQRQDTQGGGHSDLCDQVSAALRNMNAQSDMVNGDFNASESAWNGMHEGCSGRSRNMNRSSGTTGRISRERSNTSRTSGHLTGAGHSDLCEQVSAAIREIDTQSNMHNH